MRKIVAPTLFLSGTEDEMVPPSMMQELFNLSAAKKKKLVSFLEGTHNDTCIQIGYLQAIVDFWRDTIGAETENDDDSGHGSHSSQSDLSDNENYDDTELKEMVKEIASYD